jgi:hypothetical protein
MKIKKLILIFNNYLKKYLMFNFIIIMFKLNKDIIKNYNK